MSENCLGLWESSPPLHWKLDAESLPSRSKQGFLYSSNPLIPVLHTFPYSIVFTRSHRIPSDLKALSYLLSLVKAYSFLIFLCVLLFISIIPKKNVRHTIDVTKTKQNKKPPIELIECVQQGASSHNVGAGVWSVVCGHFRVRIAMPYLFPWKQWAAERSHSLEMTEAAQ